MASHPVDLSLQLFRSDWLLPVTFKHQRVLQRACDLAFQLGPRHHRIERWLWIGTLFRPDAMTPINFFNGSLISYALCERRRCLRNFRGRFGTEECKHCA